MSQPPPLRAKATSQKEESDAIVVSFGVASYQPLLEKRSKAVIRKRVPKTLTPKWIYIHVNSPVSAICARAEVLGVKHLPVKQTIVLASDLDMSVAEIRAYAGGDSVMGCYFLGRIDLPKKRLTISELSDCMVYHPPQSFFVLSREAKKVIDRMANFVTTRRKTTKALR